MRYFVENYWALGFPIGSLIGLIFFIRYDLDKLHSIPHRALECALFCVAGITSPLWMIILFAALWE